ncbi:MAG: type I DNA topoisomerase, partial [Calditrichaeota bacterium]|nr:type I DNA topoisomerase [Calditrichota bacterium]
EAISWHVHEILKKRKLLKDLPVHRVVFHEITQSAISEAMAHPRDLSMELINAQQARRALDYLVGFNLSPLLWKKIRRGLSAGRVQSPALRLIVEREMEIEEFVPQEYWTIEADVRKEQQPFVARLTRFQNKKVEQFTVVTEKNALNVRQTLLDQAAGKLTVTAVERKKRKRNPSPPFITSTLQQEASRKLGFSAQRTMMIAQQLYEGVDVGSGEVGLITYMRTDSVSLAKEAISEIRQLIKSRFGEKNLPAKPHFYRTKSKNAQEAHEAIRPTSVMRSPEAVKSHLKPEQYKLYEMIWKRTVASQMIHATINTVAVDLACGPDSTFRATGSTIEDPGFMAVYMESFDEKGDSDEGRILPDMKEGDVVDLEDIRADQHFTKPPPRFTEASLIKMLEEYGIGRPSTYASIISTLLNREYAILESRRFLPTDVGRIVNRFLTQHFEQYVDYDFTANLEDQLDEVSRGEKEWIPLMSEFWKSFNQQLEEKSQLSREEVMDARNLGTDPRTGRPVSVRLGKFGPIVQIGTREDEEKPLFAGLQPGQSMQSITLEEALKLFQLPRNLGKTPEGEEVSASIGRFGPYVRYGKQFASIKEDDPYTITLERALEVIREKKEADANKTIQEFDGTEIKVLRGRYGPYITDGQKNARIPKGKEPEALTLAECLALLEKAPAKGARKRAPRKKSK